MTGEVYDNRAWVIRAGVHQPGLQSERRFDMQADRP